MINNNENNVDVLDLKALSKIYVSNERELTVLNDINFTIKKGETVAIVGPSGSGKTTLLGLCAGLDKASSGTVKLYGSNLGSLNEDERALLRNKNVGFIFQNFQLIPTLTALENVTIPLELQGASQVKEKALELLDRVGLMDRSSHYPNQLSGGEQQRVSLARAFSNEPKLLFADEPTGNLDGETGDKIEQLLFDLNKEKDTTLIIVTHDMELAGRTDRVIKLKSGKIVSDTLNK